MRFLAPAEVTLLADRRRIGPYGARGGAPGACGGATLQHGGSVAPEQGGGETLPGKFRRRVAAGDTLTIETPGGGGWGRKR
jgi:N-methylhydantoinase B/oxoprolinase/acetone carboxylase alpha subunit